MLKVIETLKINILKDLNYTINCKKILIVYLFIYLLIIYLFIYLLFIYLFIYLLFFI